LAAARRTWSRGEVTAWEREAGGGDSMPSVAAPRRGVLAWDLLGDFTDLDEAWDSGFEVWDSGFRVEDLEFRV